MVENSEDELHRLHTLLTEAINSLGEAGRILKGLNLESNHTALKSIAKAIASADCASEMIPTDPLLTEADLPEADPPMTGDEQVQVEKLSEDQIDAIDQAILSNVGPQWRKVSALVAGLLMQSDENGIPYLFYAQRVRKLIDNGQLESQGDLTRMGYSEVRLPSKSHT
jgi:hypothetical protein